MAEVRARVDFKVGAKSSIDAEILSFKGLETDKEHVAVIFKSVDKSQEIPLVRMHSECLTGDVFHSSRCDCGEQLEETIEKMGEFGGIILYLRQQDLQTCGKPKGGRLWRGLQSMKIKSQLSFRELNSDQIQSLGLCLCPMAAMEVLFSAVSPMN